MVHNSSHKKLDYLDNLYLEKEIQNTFFPKKERRSPQRSEVLHGLDVACRGDNKQLLPSCNFYTLDEAVTKNINKSVSSSCFSIYGGLYNDMWSRKSGSASGSGCWSWSGSGSFQGNNIHTAPRINSRQESPFFYKPQTKTAHNSMFAALSCPSTPGSSLTGRLIEDTLRIPLKQQQPSLRHPRQHHIPQQQQQQHHGVCNLNSNCCGCVRSLGERKHPSQPDMKHRGESHRRETRRQDKKTSSSLRSAKTTDDHSGKGRRGNDLPVFVEAGSIRDVLEASEIWLRHTTTPNFSNKKPILKKHFINENQFYVTVS